VSQLTTDIFMTPEFVYLLGLHDQC
jgi:hypothetical protein